MHTTLRRLLGAWAAMAVALGVLVLPAGPAWAGTLGGLSVTVSNPLAGASGSEWTWNMTAASTAAVSMARFGVPSSTTSSQPRYYGSVQTSNNGLRTPSTAADRITGDLDLRAKLTMNWSSGSWHSIIGKWDWNIPNYDYILTVQQGKIGLGYSTNGTSSSYHQSTSNLAVGTDHVIWVRATLDVNNGAGGRTATFYTSVDGATWTQLGSTVTTAGTVTLHTSTHNVEVGADSNGALGNAGAKIYRAEIRNGINGPLAALMDPTAAAHAASSWTNTETSNTWTMYRTASGAYLGSRLQVVRQLGFQMTSIALHNETDSLVMTIGNLAPTVSSGQTLMITVIGLVNPTAGTYTSAVATIGSDWSTVVDSGTSSNFTFGASGPSGSPTLTMSNTAPNASGVSWTYAMSATATGSLKELRGGAPLGSSATTERYFRGTGTSYNYAYTYLPTTPTGDIDLRAKLSLSNWTAATTYRLIGQWENSPDYSYMLDLNSGNIRVNYSTNGTSTASLSSNATISAAADSTLWVRATLDVNDGSGNKVARFYTSVDGSSWTQLGTNVVSAGTITLYNSSGRLEVATSNAGSSGALNGKLFHAEVRSGIDGTVVARFDPDEITQSWLYWRGSDNQNWTLNLSRSTGQAYYGRDLSVSDVVGVSSTGYAVLNELAMEVMYVLPSSEAHNSGANWSFKVSNMVNPDEGTYRVSHVALTSSIGLIYTSSTSDFNVTVSGSIPIPDARTASFSVSSSNVRLLLDPTQANSSDQSVPLTLSLSTNAAQGYTLTSQLDHLLQTASGHVFPAVSSGTANGVLSGSFPVNTWGYAVSVSGDGVAQGALMSGEYVGFCITAENVVSSSIPAPNDVISVTMRARVDYLQPAGAYSANVSWLMNPTY